MTDRRTDTKPAPPVEFCSTCPLNREVQIYLESHERRITNLEIDTKTIRDFMVESKMLRQLTLGGGLLSIITLVVTIVNALKP